MQNNHLIWLVNNFTYDSIADSWYVMICPKFLTDWKISMDIEVKLIFRRFCSSIQKQLVE